MKKMSREEIRALVLREAKKILSEKTFPETMKVNKDDMTFTVDAMADKPGEGPYGRRKTIKGRINREPDGRLLPKAITGEDYFNPDYNDRQVSMQLSNQLRDTVAQKFADRLESLGVSAQKAQQVVQKVGRNKSHVVSDALAAIAAVASALPSDANGTQAKRILVKAILDIANVNTGFEIKTPSNLPDIKEPSYYDDEDRPDLY